MIPTRIGGSLTAITVSTKLSLTLKIPSVITTVIGMSPLKPGGGIIFKIPSMINKKLSSSFPVLPSSVWAKKSIF